MKLPEKNLGISPMMLIWTIVFLAMPPKVQTTEVNLDRWDCLKLKIFRKETTDRVKRQPSEWRKICKNYASDKG